MLRIFFVPVFVFLSIPLIAQPLQSIRGSVIDNATNTPVAFATITLLNFNPPNGAATDSSGNFLIEKIPVGRYDIKVTCVGYEPAIIREVVVNSSKQTIVNTQLQESRTALREVVVRPSINKALPLNRMATVSARMLSVEEAKRYAGGFDDPARLATSFGGVTGSTGVNGIIVRGNAPKFLQWKMEGVEIPNPNHFGNLQSFGGGILTALSSQMLANSDFFTGAFPAEYSNALSGVFDIAIRKGNNEKREHTFQAGIIGIDAASEGPFKKGSNASYLFNYRYSTLGLLAPLLPENANNIKYQDLSFNLNFPTSKSGIFSVWGLGFLDGAISEAKTDSTAWRYIDDKEQNNIQQFTGVLGVGHKVFLKNNAYVKTVLATTSNRTDWVTKNLNEQFSLLPQSNILAAYTNIVLSSFINKTFSTKHINKTGISVTGMMYDMLLRKSVAAGAPPVQIVDATGFSTLMSAFSSSTINITDKLVVNIGVNGQIFTLNNHYTIEPRAGVRYQIKQNQSFGIAYGLHSRLESLNFYFNNSLSTGEQAVNKNLDFTKSHHFVMSYDWNITDLVHLKAEPYYQYLFSVPVITNSSFSLMNLQSDWFFADKLQNTGKGRNYGIDFTLEQYMSKGYYYLLSGSIFESKYKGGDNVWRDSRFNRNYAVNFLVGKEWLAGKRKQNVISVNLRVTNQGGNRYSPVDEEESIAAKEVVFDESKAFARQFSPAWNVHFTASYKINKQKSTREIALKILNLTGQPDFNGFKYNFINNNVDKDAATIIIPNLSYRVEF